MNGAGSNSTGAQPSADAEREQFWDSCKLTTVLTEPPRHELKLPAGQIVRLRTAQFFDVPGFTVAFVDATGAFPPLPNQRAAAYLKNKFKAWLEARETRYVAEEAGDRGTLLGDIRMAIAASPETDDPRDMDRGALFANPDGSVWVSGRILMERVRRACPVKFTAADFYTALGDLGAKNMDAQRIGLWRGRAWTVPQALRPELPALPAAEMNGHAHHADDLNGGAAVGHEEPEPGLFDDLIVPPSGSPKPA